MRGRAISEFLAVKCIRTCLISANIGRDTKMEKKQCVRMKGTGEIKLKKEF